MPVLRITLGFDKWYTSFQFKEYKEEIDKLKKRAKELFEDHIQCSYADLDSTDDKWWIDVNEEITHVVQVVYIAPFRRLFAKANEKDLTLGDYKTYLEESTEDFDLDTKINYSPFGGPAYIQQEIEMTVEQRQLVHEYLALSNKAKAKKEEEEKKKNKDNLEKRAKDMGYRLVREL